MTKSPATRRIRIPVKNIDGAWECTFGGLVPVEPGTEAELVVEKAAITDKAFLKAMQAPGLYRVLDEGTTLLIGLTIKPEGPIEKTLRPHLQDYRDVRGGIATEMLHAWTPGALVFVEVKLAAPDPKQSRRLKTNKGGLWLMTKGLEATGLVTASINLPSGVSEKPVASLNHAVTKLSETFETWRISHTGNIYSRVFYQELNERWYPLEVLRTNALHQQEKTIASELWASFMAKMTAPSKPSQRR